MILQFYKSTIHKSQVAFCSRKKMFLAPQVVKNIHTFGCNMEHSDLFMQWAMTTLQQDEDLAVAVAPIDDGRGGATFPSLQALHEASEAAEMIQELIGEPEPHAANGCCSCDGGTTYGGTTDHTSSATAPRRSSNSGSATTQPVSWNFGAAPAPPEAIATDRSPPMRRAVLKTVGSMRDHIIAERKRREKINQRLIELSTVIPGLKKMDKATILSDATRYVKELQEKLKALEDGGNGSKDRGVMESSVLVKKPCIAAVPEEDAAASPPSWDPSGTSPARNPLPEIEARLLNKDVMVRIHCVDGKGVAVRVLAELEELHLSIVHANVMPFQACTLIITITAKVDEGFTVTAEEIVGRLKSAALMHQQSRCNSTEETA